MVIFRLENLIVKEREQNEADVVSYKKKKIAEANKNLYTPEFVQLEMAKSLSNNTKFYFSGSDNVLGNLLSTIMAKGN